MYSVNYSTLVTVDLYSCPAYGLAVRLAVSVNESSSHDNIKAFLQLSLFHSSSFTIGVWKLLTKAQTTHIWFTIGPRERGITLSKIWNVLMR